MLPFFTVPSSIQVIGDKKVTEGDNVTLLCRVSGMPSPIVSWMTPNGQRHSGYMLEVESTSISQAGEYKCEAINECGNATKTASIHVQFKLPGTRILTSAPLQFHTKSMDVNSKSYFPPSPFLFTIGNFFSL